MYWPFNCCSPLERILRRIIDRPGIIKVQVADAQHPAGCKETLAGMLEGYGRVVRKSLFDKNVAIEAAISSIANTPMEPKDGD
jgi:non-canonical (house-cleaning) NTP pyrophosphatase